MTRKSTPLGRRCGGFCRRFAGIVGLAAAALAALGVALWLTSVSSRVYRRRKRRLFATPEAGDGRAGSHVGLPPRWLRSS